MKSTGEKINVNFGTYTKELTKYIGSYGRVYVRHMLDIYEVYNDSNVCRMTSNLCEHALHIDDLVRHQVCKKDFKIYEVSQHLYILKSFVSRYRKTLESQYEIELSHFEDVIIYITEEIEKAKNKK